MRIRSSSHHSRHPRQTAIRHLVQLRHSSNMGQPLTHGPATPRNPGPDNFASAQPAAIGLPLLAIPAAAGLAHFSIRRPALSIGANIRPPKPISSSSWTNIPLTRMAGTAQYWLGKSAFVSGEYKRAADRFLKTFTDYPNNEKAPEALLKLAISLRRLGENNAACNSFAELARRFPQAPKTVLQRADAEKRRANCS